MADILSQDDLMIHQVVAAAMEMMILMIMLPILSRKKSLFMILEGQTGYLRSSCVLLETCMISLQETSAQIYQAF